MKSFLKFLMFVVIVAAVVGTSMYLIDETKTFDTKKDNLVNDDSNKNVENSKEKETESGEQLSGENLIDGDEISGEALESGEGISIEFSGDVEVVVPSEEHVSGESGDIDSSKVIENVSGEIVSGENFDTPAKTM